MGSSTVMWEKDLLRPTVACIATEDVEESCQLNNMTLEQMLQPFCEFPEIATPFRSLNGPMTLNCLCLKLVRASKMVSPSPETNHERLSTAVGDSEGILANMPYGSPADIPLDSESWLEGQGWYKTFRKELDNTLRWKEYSMLECPAIVLLVSTTTEPSLDVISCFHELSHPRHLPPPYSTGHYDESTVVYHYLLLHDEHRASKTSQRICDPYTVFAAMKENFPPDQCSFVPINGLQQGSENLSQPNVQWNICDELQYSGQEQVVHGAYLNSDNLSRLRKFGQELTCRHVLKSMEKRIAVLMPVANTVQNRVKSLVKSWWRKPKEGIPESGNSKGTVMYPFNSVVSQTRLLADTTLIMRDFESALSMYRAAAHQFKGDRSYLYYAAASFGAALATMMIQHSGGGSPNRVEIYMLNAEEACSHARSELLSQYDSSMQLLPAVPKFTLHLSPMPRAPIPLATRLGTQIALLHSDYLASRGLHVEAGAALVRNASNEPNLTGGVLLEKAAWHFLKGKCLRQFAFHCIMAAHVYRAAGLHVHALHCYSFALDVYEDSMWFAPKAHIHSILAYELSSMGKIQTAIIMFVRLFAGLNHDNHYCTRIEEADILTAFLNLCSMHPGAAKAASAVLAQRKGGGGVINMIIADCKENVVESSGDHLTNNEEVAFENFPLPFISDSELIVMDGSEEGEGGKGMGASDLCTSLQIGGEVDHEILQSISSPGSLAEIMCMRDELWDECKVMSSVGNRHKDGTMMTVADELAQSHRGDPYARQRNPMKPNAAWRAMGEPLSLHVVLKNPLIVPLVLESVQLTAKLMLCDAPELVTLGDPTNGSSADELQLFTAQALSQTQFDEVLQQWVNSHGKPKIRQQESDHVNNNTDPNRMVVVDDVNVTLPPTSKVSVRLRVCPLRKGLLKIDGVQWRLIKPPHDGSSSPSTVCVVGRHSFNLEGPLIHDTIEHREMRMRAPCKMLHSAVVGAMPCLICTVSGIDSTLLQGEMVSARLRVQNIGPAPAGNLLLKSNVAWLSLDEFQPESDGDCNRGSADSIPGLQHDGSSSNIGNRFTDGVSYAVGGSGTLFAPPVGPLMPGDVVELPMRIRPPEGGKHILVLLLRYKCWVPSAPNEPPSTCAGTEEDEEVKELYGRGIGCTDHFERFSYTSVGLTILPSMCALVSVSPSYATPGEYILGVEISNSRTNYDSNRIAGEDLRLYVPRVCSVSCGWRMEPLRAVDAISGEQTRCVEGAVCEWQERIMLHYRLIPVSYSTVPDGWQSLDGLPPHGCNVPLIHSDCHWDSAGTPQAVHGLDAASTQSPCLQLLCLEHAAAKFHSAKETYLRQAAAKETAGMNHPMTIQSIRRQNVQSKALETLKHENKLRKAWSMEYEHHHPTSPAILCNHESSVVTLVIFWTANVGGYVKTGQHHLHSIVIKPSSIPDNQCPLVLNVQYPSKIPCPGEVPVHACITNRLASSSLPVDFVFEARGAAHSEFQFASNSKSVSPRMKQVEKSSNRRDSSTRNSNPDASMSRGFLWLGPTRKAIKQLQPGESITIPLRAKFMRSGVFDVNRFRFIVNKKTFAFPSQYLIEVQNQ